jgi:glycosyltransferase involved in cell wall biosynthesis
MRIAIANWSNGRGAGVEQYLRQVAPAIRSARCETAFFCERDDLVSKDSIHDPSEGPVFCVSHNGETASLHGLRNWRPDLIYAHSLLDPSLEKSLFEISPSVFFAHAYYGTCISGRKSFRFPRQEVCNRTFGPECLIHYYPRKCGGFNPITMLSDYSRQMARLTNLRRCKAILTASKHQRTEYVKLGFAPDSVRIVPLPVREAEVRQSEQAMHRPSLETPGQTVSLIFVGRMVFEKGVEVLLSALPLVASRLDRPLSIKLLGDGPARTRWENKAAKLTSKDARVQVRFAGWCDRDTVNRAFGEAHLLVVPSIWPEPFGMVGPEAGMRSLPAVAFAVGGVGEWLHDGINGHLAKTNPMSPGHFAEAIVECVRDPLHYRELCDNARSCATEFEMTEHIARLMKIFHEACYDNSVHNINKVNL